MNPIIAKVGVVAAIGSVAIPATVISTRGSGYTLFDEENPEHIPSVVNNAHNFLTKAGYKGKPENKLAEFDKGRSTKNNGKFGLGCHKVIFGGKNVLRLPDTHSIKDGNFKNDDAPISDHFGSKDKPLLGCSTAALLDSTDASWGKVYDFELALRRGDNGFIERVSVWKDKAISQLVFYRRNHNPSTSKANPYLNLFAIQRTMDYKAFQIGNPKSTGEKWSDLALNDAELQKKTPIYFSIWISDSQEKGLLNDIGVKIKDERKLFSSIAKAETDTEWAFRFFGETNDKLNPSSAPHGHKIKATYTSKIAKEVEESKGIWKDVKVFCEEQKSTKYGSLNEDDVYRLRDYCYTK